MREFETRSVDEYDLEELYDFADDLALWYWYDDYQQLFKHVKRLHQIVVAAASATKSRGAPRIERVRTRHARR